MWLFSRKTSWEGLGVRTVISLTKKSASSCSRQSGNFNKRGALLMSIIIPKMDECVNFSCKWGWGLSVLLNHCPHRVWSMAGIFQAEEIGRLTGISVTGQSFWTINNVWRWPSAVQHIELLVGHGKNWVGSSFIDSYRRDLVKHMCACTCNQKLDWGRTKGEGDSDLITL